MATLTHSPHTRFHPAATASSPAERRGLVADDRPGLAEDAWEFGRARLPAYALPSRMVVVEELPQTPNGKVDLRALAARTPHPATGTGDRAAVLDDPVGRRLLAAWQRVLGRTDIGAQENFFLVGGSSLLAVQLAEAATADCGVPVTMRMVFQAPTPAALAVLVRDARTPVPEPAEAR